MRPSLRQPRLYVETNVNGTLNLLELARASGVKQFIFGSSSSVYGINAKVPFSEDDPIFNPISPYAATKAAGELLCHSYAHLYNLRILCLRFFTVYGARQRPDLAIHKFAKLISAGKPIPVFGDGTTRRDYTYIDDIISGVRAAIDYDASKYEIINLGESRTVELRELISLLEKTLDLRAEIDRDSAALARTQVIAVPGHDTACAYDESSQAPICAVRKRTPLPRRWPCRKFSCPSRTIISSICFRV